MLAWMRRVGGRGSRVKVLRLKVGKAAILAWSWRLVLTALLAALLLLLLGLLGAAWWYVPKFVATSVDPIKAVDTENATRTSVTQILVGVVALFGIGAALWNAKAAADNVRSAQDGRVTDRFSKAIEHLGTTDKIEVRLGGIYALERIARDSPKRDHATVMEVLCAFIRERAPRADEADGAPPTEPKALATDVQAALTVIGRRARQDGERQLDLSRTDLTRADLTEADLAGADLRWAILTSADLEGAILAGARLRGAILIKAELEGAILTGARMVKADLTGANPEGANLKGASLNTATLTDVSWDNTTCPDGTNSDANGNTCIGHLTPAPPTR